MKMLKNISLSLLMSLMIMFISVAVSLTSCAKHGCPTFEQAEANEGGDYKPFKRKKKNKSGLLPKNQKKYIKKNSKTLKK